MARSPSLSGCNERDYDEIAAGSTAVASDIEESRPLRGKPTPIPTKTMFALWLARVIDPMAFSQIFPYANDFMYDLGVTHNPARVGFYSGIAESIFAVMQLFTIYFWAKFSDRAGRRPVVIICGLGIAAGAIGCSLSTTFVALLSFRSLSGLFAGHAAVLLSALGEMSDKSNRGQAFSIYSLAWPTGVMLGPLFGGSFNHPAQKYPAMFDNAFWRQYPYALPAFATATVAAFSAVISWTILEETLEHKRLAKEQRLNIQQSYGTMNEASTEPPPKPRKSLGIRQLLSMKTIRSLCISGGIVSFIATGFDALFSLFCFTPVSRGGLSFSPSIIGYSLAVAGSISAVSQALILPWLLRTFSTSRMYFWSMAVWPITFLSLPLLNLVARYGVDSRDHMKPSMHALLWVGIGLNLVISRIGNLALSFNMILVREHNPNPESLASTNGLVQFAMSLFRAMGPAVLSSTFAASIDNHLLGGHAWLIVIVAICLWGTWATRGI